MSFYTFHIVGFGRTSSEFHPDEESAERAAFETALEVSRSFGRLIFVTVRDVDGELVCTAPRLPAANSSRETFRPSPAR
jgi:hypothetical protein